MDRLCRSCGCKLDYSDMFCDCCGIIQYPFLNQLLTGHPKLTFRDIANRDLPYIESQLEFLMPTTTDLEPVFKSDVNTAFDFDSFRVCLRFAMLLSRVSKSITFIPRSTAKTPDMMAKIECATIYFEVTRFIDTSLPATMMVRSSTTSLETVYQLFLRKVVEKLGQAAASLGPLVLVIESQRDWNSGLFVLQSMMVELAKVLGTYADVSGIILLYQDVLGFAGPSGKICRPQGLLVTNAAANNQISYDVAVKLGKAIG